MEYVQIIVFGILTLLYIPDLAYSACSNSVCQWEAWNAWESCSSTCGGGTRRRTRPACCQDNWTITECIANCNFDVDLAAQTEPCAQTCTHGTYSANGCNCNTGYYGNCCTEVITCGEPATVTNAVRSGNSFNYDDTVTYTCENGYNMTSGDATLRCGGTPSTSIWIGTVPTCIYVNTCSSNPCQNGGTCVNGLEQYTCLCSTGWSGTHCELDVASPVFTGCPSDQNIVTMAATRADVSWTAPICADTHGNDVFVTSNYFQATANLPWGSHSVHYICNKPSNGLQNECKFTIDVYPPPCPDLTAPEFGVFACNGWNWRYGQVCYLMCEWDREPQLGVDITQKYVCGASGNWIPPPGFIGCTETQWEPDSRTEDLKKYYYQNSCNDTQAINQIRTSYLELIRGSDFSEMCTEWDTECAEDGVNIICGQS